ncbi:MAG TPA: WD40 repeat domain-containing protein [Candidatus Angelobacter sp.]|nr:WD40 repeat domain-containing protein [Candidatus Angelobacter sp.]
MKIVGYLFLWALLTGSPAVHGQSRLKEGCRLDFTLSADVAKASGVIAFSPDGRFLAVAGTDNAIRVFCEDSTKKLTVELKNTLAGRNEPILAMRFSDTNTLVSVSRNGSAKTWDVPSSKLLHIIQLDFARPSMVVIT